MGLVRRVVGMVAVSVVALVLFGAGWLVGRTGIGSVVEPASLPDLERAFTERMRGVTLVGSYTVDGRDGRSVSGNIDAATVAGEPSVVQPKSSSAARIICARTPTPRSTISTASCAIACASVIVRARVTSCASKRSSGL